MFSPMFWCLSSDNKPVPEGVDLEYFMGYNEVSAGSRVLSTCETETMAPCLGR